MVQDGQAISAFGLLLGITCVRDLDYSFEGKNGDKKRLKLVSLTSSKSKDLITEKMEGRIRKTCSL